MNRSRTVLAVASLAGMFSAGCFSPPSAAKPSPLVGVEAPDFSLELLDGDRVCLSDFASRPVLLTFWAQGCRFCRAQATDLQRLYVRNAGTGLVVLAVNAWDENPAALRVFAREKGLTYPILLQGSAVASTLYRLQKVPAHVWIGRDGRIEDVTVGYRPFESSKMQEQADRLLHPPPASRD